jgi:hypothetical protein
MDGVKCHSRLVVVLLPKTKKGKSNFKKIEWAHIVVLQILSIGLTHSTIGIIERTGTLTPSSANLNHHHHRRRRAVSLPAPPLCAASPSVLRWVTDSR